MAWRPDASVAATTALCLLVIASTILNDETEALKLLGLKVPGLVRNGTAESAVLDCVYDLGSTNSSTNEVGSSPNSGLVVKWYFEGDPRPVYQWIPKHPPQDQGALRGRLDLGYRATNDENTMHRALFIRRPTVELSGRYTCSVSTFDDEKSVSKTMVVFVPEKTMMISQSKPRDDSVRVSCKAEGVYPEPNITLSLLRHQPGASLNHLRGEDDDDEEEGSQADSDEGEHDIDTSSLLPLEGVNVQTITRASGVFDVEAWADVSDRYLIEGMDKENPAAVSFHCLLGIPNSEYSRQKSLVYYPGPPTTPSTVTAETTHDDDNGSSAVAVSPTCFCYFLLLVLIVSQHLGLRS